MSKIIKKFISISLLIVSVVSLTLSDTNNVQAAGWMNYVQNGQLNTWISGVRSSGDYEDYEILERTYADIYKITVPSTGVLTIKTNGTDPEDNLTSYPTITIYNSQTEKIYKKWFYYAEYNDAYDYFADNISISKGTYYVEIYGGSSQYTMYIGYRPTFANTYISKIKPKKKSLTVSWAKCSGISGYQLQCSTKKNMSGAKIYTLNKNKKSKTIKGLKKKKKYYLRIRTYKIISNRNYYSSWSKVKTKKTF